MLELEERVSIIENRNLRVASDKAWEISWTRRLLISSITYGFAFILLNLIGHEGAWKHAIIPVIGYMTSTLSLPVVKAAWIKQKLDGKN